MNTIKNIISKNKILLVISILMTLGSIQNISYADGLPYLDVIKEGTNTTENALAVKQLVLLSVLSLAPSLIIVITPFTRISITLSLMRQALGLNQAPSNQVLITLAIFMSLISMSPVLSTINEEAFKPYMANTITIEEAIKKVDTPVREYMFRQTDESSLSTFINLNSSINKETIPKTYRDVPNKVLYPAYIVSEIKAGIFIGIIVSIAFLLIDLVCAGVLMGMGMMMIQPATISTIFKMMLFIFANGFELVIQTLLMSIK